MTVSTQNLTDDNRITSFGLFVEANRRVMRAIETALRDDHGLTMVELEAMGRLARSDGEHMSMSELAEQMVLTSGGATRLVDRLVAAGHVERVACPSDRRVQWVCLSAAGKTTLQTALATHLDDLDEHYFAAMSASDRKVIDKVMDRLRSM